MFGALLLIATRKWPKDDVLGTPVRIEHPDRPKQKETKQHEKASSDPNEIAAFFGLAKK